MSGLYNLINGVNPSTFVFLPILGKHPDEYPRFRDCFLDYDDKTIVVFTRVGGGNRNCGYGEDELMKDPNFVKTWDWDQDSTYGFYEFSIPDKWKSDFDLLIEGNFKEVSDDYVNEVMKVYPKIKDRLYKLFRDEETEDEKV